MKELVSGFYWVSHNNDWTIVKYSEHLKMFWKIGTTILYEEKNFDMIIREPLKNKYNE